jgi:KDEL-tailed cysteine endopeptidase
MALFLLFTSAFGQTLRGSEWNEFNLFTERFHKRYSSLEELETRFSIFRKNIITIYSHNQEKRNFTMRVNQFADLTQEEFKDYVGEMLSGSFGCGIFSNISDTPDSIDWRTKGAVTPVKDQGQCGSCWTFSATGAVEGAWSIAKGELYDLSEQELVDCAKLKYGSMGCNGGQMEGAFKFIAENGQCSLSSYPYTAKDGTCQRCSPVVNIRTCMDVEPNNALALRSAVAQQPIAVAIEADTRYFQFYAGGVLTSSTCGTNLDHGVLVVGYGTENDIDYWLVKNSWGTSWGEDGYVKIARSSANDPGICGIAMNPSFPVV